MKRKLCLLGAVLSAVIICGRDARAEREYEFGKALMESLGYFDLAEAQFLRVQDDPKLSRAERLEGTLGLGTLKKRQAKSSADADEKSKLFKEALKHFETFLGDCGDRHALRGTAIEEMADIRLEYAKAVSKQIETETDAEKRSALIKQAQALFDKALDPLKEAADISGKRYEELREKLDAMNEKAISRQQRVGLMKLLEASVKARQRYVNTMFQKTEIFPAASKERKEFVEKKILAEIDSQIEKYLEYDLVIKWFELAKGRAFAQIGDYAQAYEKGFDPVIGLDTRGMPKNVRLYVDGLRKPAYYFKAKCAYDTQNYKDAVSTVDLMIGLDYRDSLKETIGKGAVVIKTDALVALGDYNEAMKALAIIVKSTDEKDPWRNTVHQKRAEILQKAKAAGVQLERDPGALHSSAMGLYQKKKYEECVGAYREAIRAAKDPDLPYLERLKWEPRCWFEMGLAFFKMKLYYESAICFESVLENFSPHILGERFAKNRQYQRQLDTIKAEIAAGKRKSDVEGAKPNAHSELFKDLSKRKDYKDVLPAVADFVNKSADNYRKVIGLRKRMTKSEADVELYLNALKVLVEVRPELAAEKDYFFAKAVFEEGGDALTDASRLLRTNAVAAAKKLREGISGMEKAAAGFKDVKRTSSFYETALHNTANTYYRVVDTLSKFKKRHPKSIKAAEVEKYGKLSLEYYDKYLEFIKSHPAITPEVKLQRKKYTADIYLARPLVQLILGDAKSAIEGCAAYLKLKERKKEYDSLVMWTQFKAYRELATAKGATIEEIEAGVKDMVALAKRMKAHPKASRFFTTAGRYIAATYGTGSNNLIMLRKKMINEAPSVPKPQQAAYQAKLKRVEEKVKEYKYQSAKWVKDTLSDNPTMAELGSVGKVFYGLKRYEDAKAIYEKLLDSFDGDGDKKTRDLTEGEFAELREKIWYDDEGKLDKARKDFDKVKDFIFDKEESKGVPPEERTEELQDYGKAMDVIEQMVGKQGYAKDIQIKDGIEVIRKELETRLMFLVASQQISECYVALAKEAEADGDEDKAQDYWKKANKQFIALLEYWYTDVDLRFGLAGSYAALGKKDPEMYKKAMETYIELKEKVAEKSDKWFEANKALSEVFLQMGEARKALAFPLILQLTMPEYGKTMWPDMEDFVAKCKAAGAEVVDAGTGGEMAKVDYGGQDEIEREYKQRIYSAEYGKKQGTLTEAQYKDRVRKADVWLAEMKKNRARANERDAVKAKYHQMLDEALFVEKQERNEAKARQLRVKAEDWLKKQEKAIKAKHGKEDEAEKKKAAEEKKKAGEEKEEKKDEKKAGEEKDKEKDERKAGEEKKEEAKEE